MAHFLQCNFKWPKTALIQWLGKVGAVGREGEKNHLFLCCKAGQQCEECPSSNRRSGLAEGAYLKK